MPSPLELAFLTDLIHQQNKMEQVPATHSPQPTQQARCPGPQICPRILSRDGQLHIEILLKPTPLLSHTYHICSFVNCWCRQHRAPVPAQQAHPAGPQNAPHSPDISVVCSDLLPFSDSLCLIRSLYSCRQCRAPAPAQQAHAAGPQNARHLPSTPCQPGVGTQAQA